MEIPRELTEAILYAVLSDTMLLKSPTTTEVDKEVINELSKIADVDMKETLIFMRIAIAANEPGDPKEMMSRDLKVFSARGVKFGISQIFTSRPENYLAVLNRIRDSMKSVRSPRD